MHYVYAIYNAKYSKIYIGETEDVDTRIAAHNDHRFKTSFTARFDGLWKLIYSEECKNRADARKREKQLKSYRGRQFIKQFISNKQ